VKCERFLAHCDNNFHQRKAINNPAACFSPASPSSEFPSIRWVGSVGGGTSQDPWIVDRTKRHITTMLLILSMLSFLYTTLQFIYSTFIHISFMHSVYFFIVITGRLSKSWQQGATLPLLLLFIPAPGEAENPSTTRISLTISARYPSIAMTVEMTMQIPKTSLFGDHPGEQWASGHHKIPSHQHFENESRQLI